LKVWPKIEALDKNRNFDKKTNVRQKKGISVKNPNFGQK